MIELHNDRLVFSFPEAYPAAKLSIDFQRTLRIPDDGKTYPLPPGLGRFPVKHVDDFADKVPGDWREHGGVMLPMFQSEAMWLLLHGDYDPERGVAYPFAIKVAAGKIDAVTGNSWSNGLHRSPQDYMISPGQPWLDGFCVEKGTIRQFVAMPLGAGYTAEEQITGKAEHGGLQIAVYPMKRDAYERRFPIRPRHFVRTRSLDAYMSPESRPLLLGEAAMGLAPGGRMKQEIYADPFRFDDWDHLTSSRCFVHIANSLTWRAITGAAPPSMPPTAKQYSQAGLPWFDYYDESAAALPGSGVLSKLKSVFGMGKEKGEEPLPENEPCEPAASVLLKPKKSKHQVREGSF
ncbi:MAG: hypothetical protein HY040_12110 [Planctomycetes bacterium]|nr:hypothetical protein [Planctomycetota bacterium]